MATADASKSASARTRPATALVARPAALDEAAKISEPDEDNALARVHHGWQHPSIRSACCGFRQLVSDANRNTRWANRPVTNHLVGCSANERAADPPPRAEDIRWLEWPKEDGDQAESPSAGGRVINHPERSPEHVSFRVELPDGRSFQGSVRGVLQIMSDFNQENGWPDEADHASIWKPATDSEGVVLDFEAMEERERQHGRTVNS